MIQNTYIFVADRFTFLIKIQHMSRIIHFEIPSADPDIARDFYNKVFGWEMTQWADQPYWLCNTGDKSKPGIDGAIIKKRGPDHHVVNTIEVDNLDNSIRTIEEHGGVIVVPRMPIPGIGWVAYFKDPDQNILGVMESDVKA